MNSARIEDLRSALNDREVAVFVGAGVSIATAGNLPTLHWRGLIEHGISWCCEYKDDLPNGWSDRMRAALEGDEIDLLSVADTLTKRLESPHGNYARWLKAVFGDLEIQDNGVINALLDLDAPIVTTNYDDLISRASPLLPCTWMDIASTQSVFRDVTRRHIVHLHGVWSRPDTVILGISDYERILGHGPTQSLMRALQSLKSILFVGFGRGLGDPNFSQLFKWAQETLPDSPYGHFRLVRERDAAEARQQHRHDKVTVLTIDDGENLGSLLRQVSPGSKRLGRVVQSKDGNLGEFWKRYASEGITVVVPPREEDEILKGQHGYAYLGMVVYLQRVASILNLSAAVSTSLKEDEKSRNLISFTGPIPNKLSREILDQPGLVYGFEGHELVSRIDPSLRFAMHTGPTGTPIVDHGLITCIRNPWSPSHTVLVAAGCFAWGTQAAMRLLADEDTLGWLLEQTHGQWFQVVCRADIDPNLVVQTLGLVDCYPDPTHLRPTFQVISESAVQK